MKSAEPPQVRSEAQTSSVTVDGRYVTDSWVQGSTYSAAAYVVVPKVEGGLWYTVTGSGFNDTAYYGQRLSLTFSAARAAPRADHGHGDTRVQDRGDTLWVCLSRIRGPVANQDEAAPYFDARFGGMAIQVVVSVHKTPS
jgi:hypothetical protein